jgi:hypothetical protein
VGHWAQLPNRSSPNHFVHWERAEDLHPKLLDALVEEPHFQGPDDVAGFKQSLGGLPSDFGGSFGANQDGLPPPLAVGAECYAGLSSFLYSRMSPG